MNFTYPKGWPYLPESPYYIEPRHPQELPRFTKVKFENRTGVVIGYRYFGAEVEVTSPAWHCIKFDDGKDNPVDWKSGWFGHLRYVRPINQNAKTLLCFMHDGFKLSSGWKTRSSLMQKSKYQYWLKSPYDSTVEPVQQSCVRAALDYRSIREIQGFGDNCTYEVVKE